jgi:hypothetical protein
MDHAHEWVEIFGDVRCHLCGAQKSSRLRDSSEYFDFIRSDPWRAVDLPLPEEGGTLDDWHERANNRLCRPPRAGFYFGGIARSDRKSRGDRPPHS